MKPITIQDITTYKFLSGLAFSPDGKHVAVVAAKAEVKENGYRRHIYVADSKTMKFKKLTGSVPTGMFVWSDNNTIVFPRMTEKEDKEAIAAGEELTVFCSIDIDGGEASELFRVEAMATGIKKLGDDFVITAKTDLNRPDLTGLKGDKRKAALAKYKAETKDFQVADELPFWFNGMGFINKLRSRVFIYKTSSKTLVPVTEPAFNTSSVSVSENGDFLLITGIKFDKLNAARKDGIYKYCVAGGKMTELVPSGVYGVGQAAVMGDNVIFMASYQENDYDFVSPDFYSVPLDGSEKAKKIMDFDGDAGCQTGSDCRLGGGTSFKVVGDSLYMINTEDNMAGIVEIKDSKIRTITDKSVCFDSFDIKDGKCVATAMTDVTLQEVYTVDLESGSHKKVSGFNKKALDGKYVAPCTPMSFINKDGVRIDGWVLFPRDYDPAKKYPGILEIHGGPRSTYGAVFMHEMQVFASDGYFVFFCNPRGGSSRGNEFAHLAGKYGTIDYEDLMEFTDKVLEKYPQIDGNKLGVTGGSYGGYMTNWVIGHTDRFKAGVSQRSIANWVAFNFVSDISLFGKREMQTDIFTDPDKIWWHSPMKYADKAKTPTMFIHSFEDYRCWRPESEQMYRSLLNNKVPTRICFFKGENHELSRSGKPKHRMRRLKEMTEWLYKYINA